MYIEQTKADLAYMSKLMEQTRQAASLSGSYFIVWGIVVALGLVATWMHIVQIWTVPLFPAWIVCLALGGAVTWLLVRREPVESMAGRLVAAVWIAFGAALLVIFFVGVGTGTLAGAAMPALASSLVGAAVFLTGTLAGLNWLRLTAVGWWAGAAAMFVWPGPYILWQMGLMLLAFYVIPGVMLMKCKPAAGEAGRV